MPQKKTGRQRLAVDRANITKKIIKTVNRRKKLLEFDEKLKREAEKIFGSDGLTQLNLLKQQVLKEHPGWRVGQLMREVARRLAKPKLDKLKRRLNMLASKRGDTKRFTGGF
jgi:hypothetical protein